jgi:SHS2 domain-containing protein
MLRIRKTLANRRILLVERISEGRQGFVGRMQGSRVAYQSFDANGVTGLTLTGGTLEEVFANAAVALTDFMTPLAAVEPRQPEEVDVAAPELEVLLVDFLTELLYRFDTRGWLTRAAEVQLRERDGGWSLEGTLLGDGSRDDSKFAVR